MCAAGQCSSRRQGQGRSTGANVRREATQGSADGNSTCATNCMPGRSHGKIRQIASMAALGCTQPRVDRELCSPHPKTEPELRTMRHAKMPAAASRASARLPTRTLQQQQKDAGARSSESTKLMLSGKAPSLPPAERRP